jgi:hypothetical protein
MHAASWACQRRQPGCRLSLLNGASDAAALMEILQSAQKTKLTDEIENQRALHDRAKVALLLLDGGLFQLEENRSAR